jgi:uncharacterized membrane protein
MVSSILFAAVFAAAIGSGLVAGIFFAFSTFVMAALGRLPVEQGVTAMNAINVTVINPMFMTAFMGTGVLCLALAAGSYVWWADLSGKLVLIASVVYLIGCIGVTMVFNVPLNDALAAVQPASPEAASLWARYLNEWVFWNHVRTVAPTLSMALFITALLKAA